MAEDGDFKTLRPIVRKINIAAANPEAYQKLVKNGFNQGFWQITNEIFINSILSSPVTHQVNMLATGLNSLSRPLTLALGAKDEITRGRAVKETIYAIQAIKDSLALAKKSFQYDTNILDRGSQVVDFERMSLEGSNRLIRGLSTRIDCQVDFLWQKMNF